VVTGLAAGTSYDFYVAANSAGSGSTASSTVTASTTTIAAPERGDRARRRHGDQLHRAAVVDGAGNRRFAWAAATYTIQYRINGSSTWATAASGISTAYYTVTGLIAGLEYQFNVFGVNAAGTGAGTTTTATPARRWAASPIGAPAAIPPPLSRMVRPERSPLSPSVRRSPRQASVVGNAGRSAGDVAGDDVVQRQPAGYGSYSANMPASAGTWYGWMIFYDSAATRCSP